MVVLGKTINSMVWVFTTSPMEIPIRVKLSMVRKKVWACITMLMEMFILGRGAVIRNRERDIWPMPMGILMRARLLTGESRALACTHGSTVIHMRAHLSRISNMERVCSVLFILILLCRVCGKMIE